MHIEGMGRGGANVASRRLRTDEWAHAYTRGCARGRARGRSPLTHPLIHPFAQMLMIIHATDLLCAARASPSDAAMRRLGKRQEAGRKSEREREREKEKKTERAKMLYARNRE